MSKFFWSLIIVYLETIGDEKFLPAIRDDLYDEIYDDINDWGIIQDNRDLFDRLDEFLYDAFPLAEPIKTTYYSFLIYTNSPKIEKLIPEFDFQSLYLDSMYRISYLVLYEINKEKILAPLAYALNKSYKNDLELIAVLTNFADGEFIQLIDSFNPENRNTIAHVAYFSGKKGILQYKSKKGEMKKLNVSFQNDIHVFNALDGLLDKNVKDTMRSLGIAKLIINLTEKFKEDGEYYINEAKALREEEDFSDIYAISLLTGSILILKNNRNAEISEFVKDAYETLVKRNSKELFYNYSFLLAIYTTDGRTSEGKRTSLIFLRQVLKQGDSKGLDKDGKTFHKSLYNFTLNLQLNLGSRK